MRSRVCVTIGRLSVRLSHRSTAAAVASRFLLLNAVRVGDIDGQLQAPVPRTSCRRAQQQRRRTRRSVANAGSVMLRAEDEAEHKLVFCVINFVALFNICVTLLFCLMIAILTNITYTLTYLLSC